MDKESIDRKYKITYKFDTSDLYKWQENRFKEDEERFHRNIIIIWTLTFILVVVLIISKANGVI